MTSSAAEQPPLMNGDEDPYKSEGHIELKIVDFSEFIKEELWTERLSEPAVHVRGVAWKLSAVLRALDKQPAAQQNGQQKQKCLGFYLEYCNGSTDTSRTYEATVQLKILAQKKGGVDHVYEISNSFKFKGMEYECAFMKSMTLTIEDLMNPDRGFYDKQSDSITLAADLSVNLTEGGDGDDSVGEYMLVAQNELTLDKVPTSIAMQVANLQWQINFDADKNGQKSLVLTCKDVVKSRGMDNKVMLELLSYRQDADPKSESLYSPIVTFSPNESATFHRHLFTREDSSMTVAIPAGEGTFNNSNKLLFTFRVFKQCSQFPDFTKPTAMVGRFSAGVKLRVGDQQFHVNRQLLSMHSLFFDRMFHGDYTAATQQEVELSLKTHSVELFHHFLLVMCVNEILPNSTSVAAFFKLADFYDAENVRQKCDQHLRMAREMPIEKRVLLARDHGSKETQAQIVDSFSFEQFKRITNNLFMQNR